MDELTHDRLAGDWRIWQRKHGHRWSTDDLLFAWLAARTRPDEELRGLVYSLTERKHDEGVPLLKRPAFLGVLVMVAVVVLNILFW